MSQRTNLIMHFHCTECGHQLELSYPQSVKVDPVKSGIWQTEQEPTGAGCCYTPTVWVEPCRHCIEKHTKPAKQLTDALAVLNSFNKEL